MVSDFLVEPIYGDLPEEWSLTSIGELEKKSCADIQTGPFGTMLHAESYVQIGTPIVAVKNIGENCFLHVDLPRVCTEDRMRLARYVLREGDIVFGRKGAVERRAYVTSAEDGWLQGSDCIRVRFNSPENVHAKFISYVIGSSAYYEWIMRNAQGATMPSLNQEIIRRIPLPFPPLPEQRAIARILGSLDDKIELNRRMNRTLEEMARSIFKSWFVDFDPVHAKAEGRAPFGMDGETAALFPDGFEDSELGEVPRGWKVGTIADIAKYVNGKNFTKNASGTGRMVIRIAELNSGPGGSTKYNGVEADPENTAYPDDILFAWSGSLGVYRWHDEEALINQHIFKVICQKYPKWFIYYHLCDVLPFFREVASDKATTMGHIKRTHLSESKLVIPSDHVLIAASKTIEPIYQKIHQNECQSRTLAALRDALLPKLISGEIRVKDAEELADAGAAPAP